MSVTNEGLVHTIYLCHVTVTSKSGREGGKKRREEREKQRKNRSKFALGLVFQCSL